MPAIILLNSIYKVTIQERYMYNINAYSILLFFVVIYYERKPATSVCKLFLRFANSGCVNCKTLLENFICSGRAKCNFDIQARIFCSHSEKTTKNARTFKKCFLSECFPWHVESRFDNPVEKFSLSFISQLVGMFHFCHPSSSTSHLTSLT